ncbi:MAG: methyl-accepting chemotaxis protein [Methylococcus sp.]|nr:MAG: methyl-accepting chemotaxis protein [Methylococcus sp.]
MNLKQRLLSVVLPLLTLSVVVSVYGLSHFAKRTALQQASQDGQILANVLLRTIEVSQTVEVGTEEMAAKHLIVSARILSNYVAVAESCKIPATTINDRLRNMVNPDLLGEVLISDQLGKTTFSNLPEDRLKNQIDPLKDHEAEEFWPLLKASKDMSITQPLKRRNRDGRLFKYVGVPGVDRPRIVQVSMAGDDLKELQNTMGVQALLENVVLEDSIDRVWVVNQSLETQSFVDENNDPLMAEIEPADRLLLKEAISQNRPSTRLDPRHIAIAAPLTAIVNTDNHTIGKNSGSKDPFIRAPVASGAILIHMSTELMNDLLDQESTIAMITGGLSLLFGALLVAGLTRRIVKPIDEAVKATEQVASGDLSVQLSSDDHGETGKLLSALARMVDYLNKLIGQVRTSTETLLQTGDRLSRMTHSQRQEIKQLGTTTLQIAAATQEITATSEELLKTMGNISSGADVTAQLANTGQASLESLEAVMRSLGSATQSISHRLSLITEKANTISGVTTTITRIADQTNLLSLNASIEAEKAGDYGLGFAVLAREIRRLADQTAQATLDIEQMVDEMQDSVTTGVREMDQFTQQVQVSVADTETISDQFNQIIAQIQNLIPAFDVVYEGMRSQSAGAKDIRDSMTVLKESVRISAEALEESALVTESLETAINTLEEGVNNFTLKH